MASEKYTSVVEALDITIKRIRENYNGDWMKTGSPGNADGGLPEPSDGEDQHYVRIFEPEYHGYTEICACVSGSFALQMDRQIVEVNEGDVCLILPGLLHNELPSRKSGYTAIWAVIDFNRAVLHLSGSSKDKPLYTLEGCFLKPDYEYIHMVDNIRMEMDARNDYYEDMVKSLLLRLLVTVYRGCASELVVKPESQTWKESVIIEVQKYIMNNYSRHIRLNDISQIVCISPNYLNTLFKSVMGKTIIQYHEDYRMDMARKMLKGSELSISDIADRLGYYDQYHFSKIFKKATGLSPLQYRKEQSERRPR